MPVVKENGFLVPRHMRHAGATVIVYLLAQRPVLRKGMDATREKALERRVKALEDQVRRLREQNDRDWSARFAGYTGYD